jgi:integrase
VQTIALWAHDKGMVPDDIPWADPFAKMRLPEEAPERDAFDIHELQTLFASPVFNKGERPAPGRGEAAFWLPLLSLYTGARQSELAMLTVNDVRKVDGTNVFQFVEDKAVGKTLKTRSSIRTVPVHPQLVKLGWLIYLDLVRRSGDERSWLFPQVAPNVPGGRSAWSKWFNRMLRDIGITDRRKVFHSFRHTFKDALRTARVGEDVNDALTGHSNSSVGRGYGAKETVRRFGMPTLKDAVARVTYKGLNLTNVRFQPQKRKRRA